MKHLKKFNESKYFPNIDSICTYYEITNYSINNDGTVDVNGTVDISGNWYNGYGKLTKLPLKFGRVTGSFYCNDNELITLEGSPKEVGGDFSCKYNKLQNLLGGPKEVGGYYNCVNNKLTSLEGGPKEVGDILYCIDNPIDNIYKLFKSYKKYQDSLDYNYLRGTNIVKSRLKEALEEIGETLPDKIKGYNYI